MKSNDPSANPDVLPPLDLNELLLDHPAASFIFECDGDVMIVDRAVKPHTGSTVVVEAEQGFVIEIFHGQNAWGVVIYHLHKID